MASLKGTSAFIEFFDKNYFPSEANSLEKFNIHFPSTTLTFKYQPFFATSFAILLVLLKFPFHPAFFFTPHFSNISIMRFPIKGGEGFDFAKEKGLVTR